MRTVIVLLLALFLGAAALPARERVRHRTRVTPRIYKFERQRDRAPRLHRFDNRTPRAALRRHRARI